MSIYEALQLLALVAVPIVAGGLGLIVYRVRSLQNAIDRNDERLDGHAERLAALEAQVGVIAHLREDMNVVHRRVDEIHGKVSQLEGQVAELTKTSRLILEHLMQKEN